MENYTNTLLNRVKQELNLGTDYQLAKLLGVGTSRIANYRSGRSVLDWDMAFKLGDLLHEDDENVVHGLMHEKAMNPRLINVLEESKRA
ncbi:transcriptional regulator [Vibrio viridaestus]|uniref:Transcriptional regulator n=2 Tax=Vibrio viridaestus TaxID=2487322 RepID=A0A3N9TVU7_9VIBR|nr:transcriptional regulator [Vibrio viridaestus]RQW61022.1 transcriptional regulator [Vibrio viridaestus]